MATRTGLEPSVPPGLTIRHSSNRARAPGWTFLPESGWPESNRWPRRPERRALPGCATTRCDSSRGRGTIHRFLVQNQTASVSVDPDGLEPSSSSLQGRCIATRALGPRVRGAGVEPAMPKHLGYDQVPSLDGNPRRGSTKATRWHRCGPRSHCWRSLQLSRSILGATRQAIWAIAHRTRRGAGNRTLASAGLEAARLPAPRPSVVLFVVVSARKPKEPPPSEAALKRSSTCIGPRHTVESAPMGKSLRNMSWSAPACDATRNVSEATSPSFFRNSRSFIASWHCMGPKYMNPKRICEEPKAQCPRLCG